MIITCASCLTKFNLDDSRIQEKGIKVRCSRCKHVFYVVPPPETREEIIENAESFAKYHADLIEPGERKAEAPPEASVQTEEAIPKAEEAPAFLFPDKAPVEEAAEQRTPPGKMEESVPPEETEMLSFEEPKEVEKREGKPSRPKTMLRAEKRGPLRYVPLLIVLVLLLFGIFYVWTELSMGGKLSSYLDYSVKKANELWDQIWGVEKEDLNVGEISFYDAQVEGLHLFVVEGNVKNQSKLTKKYIRMKISIFDEDKVKVAEQDVICGRMIRREELKNQPPEFFKGDMVIKPQSEQEMIVPPGKTAPFMMIFKDLPRPPKDYRPEILEAPNL